MTQMAGKPGREGIGPMTKQLGVWLLMLGNVFIWAQNDETGRKKPAPDLNDHVEVVNIEMLARVQKGGQPVSGLQKSDFILKENGRPVEINGFREEHHRINPPPATGEKATVAKTTPAGRLFVLWFSIWDRNAAYSEALDHFFAEIYRTDDHLILAHTKEVLPIDSPDQITAVRTRFETGLKKSIASDNQARELIYRQIDDAIYDYLHRIPGDGSALMRLQHGIANSWKEFQARFLRDDPGSLVRLADSMKSINREKWVLLFLQEEVFPRFNEDGEIPAFSNRLEEMRQNLGDHVSTFSEKIRSSFIAAGATVSLIRLNSRGLEDQGRSNYYRQQPAFSNRDECFRQISRVTGGTVISDNDMVRALDRAAEKEDVCYVISYVPADNSRKQKIQLTCRDTSLNVFAGRRPEIKNPYQLTITHARVTNSTLSFNLSGYTRLFEAGQLQGRLQVRVTANGNGVNNLENIREFTPTADEVEIPVVLRLPRGRRYSFRIRVVDQISGRELVKETTLRNM
jgi:hypothetical protein